MDPSTRRTARVLERLTGEPIDATTLAGLQGLVDDVVPEGSQLDYKVTAYEPGSAGKKDARDELRKDVTAMANAAGGVLVLGLADTEGLPTKVVGLTGNLEQIEGHLRQTLASRVEPYVDGVDVLPVAATAGQAGCLLVIVPSSPRKPHAVRPMADDEALKFARRVGRHTEWLSEAQVADLYRNRFADARTQQSRMDEIESQALAAMPKRGWLVTTLVPDDPGVFAVNREAIDRVMSWWLDRRRLGLIPEVPISGVDTPTFGPARVLLGGHDATSVPVGYAVSFHTDGSIVMAQELDGPDTGNPALYFDHLVSHVIDAVDVTTSFAVDLGGTGGLGLIKARLHFPEKAGPIYAWDPSFGSPSRWPRSAEHVETIHTIDLDAVAGDAAQTVAVAAVVAASLAQHFGQPDSLYLTPEGVIRVNQFPARERDHHVIPRATELGVPTTAVM